MRLFAVLLAPFLLAAATAATAAATQSNPQQQRVYQWKDAKGVPHYTDVKPKQSHETRDIDTQTGSPAETGPAKPKVESEQCHNARTNLLRLQSSDSVGVDTNGDGKPDRNMSADERKAQLDLNQAAVKAYCTPSK